MYGIGVNAAIKIAMFSYSLNNDSTYPFCFFFFFCPFDKPLSIGLVYHQWNNQKGSSTDANVVTNV